MTVSRKKIAIWKRMLAACVVVAFVAQILAPPATARPTDAGHKMSGSVATNTPPADMIAEAHSVVKAEAKGQVESYSNGTWTKLKGGTFTFDPNGAWRTGPSGVVTITFEDGSTISLQGGSAMRIVEDSSNRFHIKAIGMVKGSLSTAFVGNEVIVLEFPTAAVGINDKLTPSSPGGGPVVFTANTPNAREVRVAVEKGAVATTGLPNVKGVVVKNPNTGELLRGKTFWLKEDMTGRFFEINVSDPLAVIASSTQADATKPNEQKLQQLKEGEPVTVYGPVPKEAGMASAYTSDAIAIVPILVMNAVTLFPGNMLIINGASFVVTQPITITGFTSATVAGNTAVVTVGQSIAVQSAGLTAGATSSLAGLVGAGILVPVAVGAAAVAALAIVVTENSSP